MGILEVGQSWCPLGAVLGASWAVWGPSRRPLRRSWGHLGDLWGRLGRHLGGTSARLGDTLGPSWVLLGPS
eukprot:9470657-Pyramimonas_sp.AAC.1